MANGLAVLWAILAIPVNVAVVGTFSGAVKEHCADLDNSGDVDSHWTYILFPPMPFASIDPAGGCVRNNPAREAAAAVGIWSLPSPEEQVRAHIKDQLRAAR